MFFPRLRRQAKWAFVFLALVFGLGFVVFGVGSGLPSGLGDILRQQSGGTGVPSPSDARERVEDNPNNPEAYAELATAYQADGKPDEAIPPLEHYLTLRPKDREKLEELAGLYLAQATRLQREAQAAQAEAALAQGGTLFSPQVAPGTPTQDPVTAAVTQRVNERLTRAYTAMQEAFGKAKGIYQRIVPLAPGDATVQIQLAQAAQFSNDPQTAIRAYQRFLKLAPDDPNVPLVRQELARLRSASQGAGSG
jgi:tetratricopeptide (TPR) repeat protein